MVLDCGAPKNVAATEYRLASEILNHVYAKTVGGRWQEPTHCQTRVVSVRAIRIEYTIDVWSICWPRFAMQQFR